MALSNLKIGTRLYLAFGAVIALLAILVASAQANFSRLGEANRLNIHTYQVMGEANALLESLINIETGERGFALRRDAGLRDCQLCVFRVTQVRVTQVRATQVRVTQVRATQVRATQVRVTQVRVTQVRVTLNSFYQRISQRLRCL